MLTSSCREFFSFPEDVTYLDHGGFGVTPKEVLAAAIRTLKDVEKAPRIFYNLHYGAEWNRIRAAVAHRFSVRAEDLALVSNATDGLNAVLRSLPFRQDDEIVINSMSYGAVANMAKYIAGRLNARVITADFHFPNPDPDQFIAAVKAALTRRTKLVILDHIAAFKGLVMPLREMITVCREHNVPVLVDGAHAPGQIAFNIESLNADWYVANLHKWHFAPRGCGFLWARRDRQKGLVPATLSWDIEKPFPHSYEWTGTRESAPWMSIPAAFEFMDRFILDNVTRHNRNLLREARHLLAETWKVPVPSPDDMSASMGVISLPDGIPFPATDEGRLAFQSALWEKHKISVCVPFEQDGRIWIRIAAQIYNELADYEKLAAAVQTLQH